MPTASHNRGSQSGRNLSNCQNNQWKDNRHWKSYNSHNPSAISKSLQFRETRSSTQLDASTIKYRPSSTPLNQRDNSSSDPRKTKLHSEGRNPSAGPCNQNRLKAATTFASTDSKGRSSGSYSLGPPLSECKVASLGYNRLNSTTNPTSNPKQYHQSHRNSQSDCNSGAITKSHRN